MDEITKLLSNFFTVLSDPLKLQILKYLKYGELSTKEIKRKLNISQSYTSQQINQLISEGLIYSHKTENRVKFYNIKYEKIFEILDLAKAFLKKIEADKYKRLFEEEFQL